MVEATPRLPELFASWAVPFPPKLEARHLGLEIVLCCPLVQDRTINQLPTGCLLLSLGSGAASKWLRIPSPNNSSTPTAIPGHFPLHICPVSLTFISTAAHAIIASSLTLDLRLNLSGFPLHLGDTSPRRCDIPICTLPFLCLLLFSVLSALPNLPLRCLAHLAQGLLEVKHCVWLT